MTDAITTALKRGPTDGAGAEQASAAARRLGARIAAEGLADVFYGEIDSPFGTLHAASTARGLVRLAFPEESREAMLELLARRISPRIVEGQVALDPVRRELEDYFAGRRRAFELALDWSLIGPFGRRRPSGAGPGPAGSAPRDTPRTAPPARSARAPARSRPPTRRGRTGG